MTTKQQKKLVADAILQGKWDVVPEGISRFVLAVKANAPEGFVDKFDELKSDDERVSYLWKEPIIHDIINLEPEYCAKSSTEAAKFRQNGNKYFQKKAYLSAISEYSKSIMQAPQQSSIASENELALAFANRSAALFHFGKYHLCLSDIDFAFEHGYPEDLQYKLYDRQGKCYSKLGRKAEAHASFNKAQESLQHAKMDEKYLEIWKTNLAKEIAHLDTINESHHKLQKDEDVKKKPAPQLGTQINDKYQNATQAVDIQCKKGYGRYGVASQDVNLGEVLVVEKPFASVLYEDFHGDHCYNCFQKALAPVPCPESSSVLFCSRDCRDKAWDCYQKWEYKYMALLEKSLCGNIGHLALRILFEAGVSNVLSYITSQEVKDDLEDMSMVGMTKEGMYDTGYSSIYPMLSHSASRKPENHFELAVMACFLLKVLQITGVLKEGEKDLDTEENLKLLGGVLMRHLQIVQCNANKVMIIQNPNNFHEPKPAAMGIAIYSTVALLNHSCDPVVDAVFYGNTAVVRAIRNINKDSELSISYGPTYYDDHFVTRLAELKATYFFDCRCVACKEEWPMWLELDNQDPLWLCTACGNILLSDKMQDRKFAKCKKCSHMQNMEEVLDNLGTSHDMYSKSMAEALSGRYDNALPGLVNHLSLQQKCIEQPWRDFIACQVAVKHCFRMMANVVE